MNIFQWITLILGCLYGGLTLFACLMQYRLKHLIINTLMLTGAIMVIISVILIDKYNTFFYLVVSMILIHISAILNGYKMFKKINIKHHIIRLIISLLIIVLYILG